MINVYYCDGYYAIGKVKNYELLVFDNSYGQFGRTITTVDCCT